MTDCWLTTREVSILVRVAPQTLANWRSLGIGPSFIKLSGGKGGRVRYSESVIRAWLAERGIKAA